MNSILLTLLSMETGVIAALLWRALA